MVKNPWFPVKMFSSRATASRLPVCLSIDHLGTSASRCIWRVGKPWLFATCERSNKSPIYNGKNTVTHPKKTAFYSWFNHKKHSLDLFHLPFPSLATIFRTTMKCSQLLSPTHLSLGRTCRNSCHQCSQQARLGVPPQQMAETLWCLPTNQLNQSWVGSWLPPR